MVLCMEIYHINRTINLSVIRLSGLLCSVLLLLMNMSQILIIGGTPAYGLCVNSQSSSS